MAAPLLSSFPAGKAGCPLQAKPSRVVPSFETFVKKHLTEDIAKELRSCINQARVASCLDTVVKTQCTYSLDTPLSPCGLFINLRTFLAASIDSLLVDCLVTPSLSESNSQADSTSASSPPSRTGAGHTGEESMGIHPHQRLYLHVYSNVDGAHACKILEKIQNAPTNTDVKDTSSSASSSSSSESQKNKPSKLAIGVEGGFCVDEGDVSGDACPSALTQTFLFSLVLLPSRITLPSHSYPRITRCSAGSLSSSSSSFSSGVSSSSPSEKNANDESHIQEAQMSWEKSLLTQFAFLSLESEEIPEMIRSACQALIEHRGTGASASSVAGGGGGSAWEEEIKPSKYAEKLEQIPNPPSIGPNNWRCADCGASTNLWLNLSDGHIGCGRKLYGVGGGCADGREGAALRHYNDTGKKYPLIVKLGTITPYTADVYSYASDEDTSVLDPLLPDHLSHFGVNIQQLSKTEKTTSELALDWNVQHEWSRATEDGKDLKSLQGAGCIGLRNLGNTCYINSVLQVVTSIPAIREKYVSLYPLLLTSLPCGSTVSSSPSSFLSDFLLQQSSLTVALQTHRYRIQDVRRKADILQTVLAKGLEEKLFEVHSVEELLEKYQESSLKGLKYLDMDSVTPQVYRQLVGKLHAEFATSHQQDAEEFLSLLLQWLECRDKEVLKKLDEAGKRLNTAKERTSEKREETGEKKKADLYSSIVAAVGCKESDLTRAQDAVKRSDIKKLFTFAVEQRVQCQETKKVRYSYLQQQILSLPVPLDPRIQEEFEQAQKAQQEGLRQSTQHQKAERTQKRHKKLSEAEEEEEEGGKEEEMEKRDTAAEQTASISQTSETPSSSTLMTTGGSREHPASVEEGDARLSAELNLPSFTFSECLNDFLASSKLTDYYSAATKRKGEASKTLRLATFPPYLLVQLKRFFADQHWQAKKLYCSVRVPEEICIAHARGEGLQEGESLLPEDDSCNTNSLAPPPPSSGTSEAVDPELLATLQSMGFSEKACRRACREVKSSNVDACIDWLVSHMDEADMDGNDAEESSSSAPTSSSSSSSAVDDCSVVMLLSMGFSEKQARAGLKAVGPGGGEDACARAADWILNNPMDDDQLDTFISTHTGSDALESGGGDEVTMDGQSGGNEDDDSSGLSLLERARKGLDDRAEGVYKLHGFITHIGKNANCGHYVCHVKKGGKLVLFNDEKVAEAVDPPVDLGYIYVFRRADLVDDEA